MGVEDEHAGDRVRSRAAALRATMLEPNTLRALEASARVTVLAFGERTVPVPGDDPSAPAPSEDASLITGSLAKVLAELETGSTVVVMSDGRETAPNPLPVDEVAGLARAAGVRVHAVPVGSPERAYHAG